MILRAFFVSSSWVEPKKISIKHNPSLLASTPSIEGFVFFNSKKMIRFVNPPEGVDGSIVNLEMTEAIRLDGKEIVFIPSGSVSHIWYFDNKAAAEKAMKALKESIINLAHQL